GSKPHKTHLSGKDVGHGGAHDAGPPHVHRHRVGDRIPRLGRGLGSLLEDGNITGRRGGGRGSEGRGGGRGRRQSRGRGSGGGSGGRPGIGKGRGGRGRGGGSGGRRRGPC